MENRFEAMQKKAIADCKDGKFAEAEQTLTELLEVLKRHGAPLTSSPTMYWFLLAKHKGDQKKAMDELTKPTE